MISIEQIQKDVAFWYSMTVDEMLQRTSKREFLKPRYISMYFCWKQGHRNMTEIEAMHNFSYYMGRVLTVVDIWIKTDKQIAFEVHQLDSLFNVTPKTQIIQDLRLFEMELNSGNFNKKSLENIILNIENLL